MRWIIIGAAVFAAFFAATLRAIDVMAPPEAPRRPPQVATRPLEPITKPSLLITPIAVSTDAIRDALDAAAPRDLAGKRQNPATELLSKAEVAWTVARGPLGVASRSDALAVTTTLNGTLRLTGQLGNQASALGNRIAGFAGNDVAQAVQNLAGKTFDQKAELRGNVAVLARPSLTPAWRLDPHLTSQVTVADVSLPVSGNAFNVGKDVKPLVDRAVAEQVAALEARMRNDPAMEQAARREWARMCRSVSLKDAAAGMPDLWLEIRPVRAFAAQPRVDAQAVNLVFGVQAETRVIPQETMPTCPFPAELEIVPSIDRGRISIALAIDVPFAEVNRLLEAQIAGRSFPQDGSGGFTATIESASVAGAGDRLLVALKVKARETASWLGSSTPADVFVWGRPVLDRDNQILRLADVTVDADSQSAFAGAAAHAALPYLQPMLAQWAAIDLKPFAASARRSIEATVGEFARRDPGVRIEAAITDLQLSGIAFDAATLRVVVEVNGTVHVDVAALPK